MKDKFFTWFGRNRRPIGYAIGVLNLLTALSHFLQGNLGLMLVWLVIGCMIIFDTWEFK